MIYVMSDIHGYYTRYESVMEQIQLQDSDHLYVLGDCIDRFPDGLAILDELVAKPNVTVLLGNHEYMMLAALTQKSSDSEEQWIWYRNGGDITHDYLNKRPKEYQKRVLDIIRSLPLNAEVECNGIKYLLVHGWPYGHNPRGMDLKYEAVWRRIDPYSTMPEGKTIIFGHSPTDRYQQGYPMRIYYGKQMIGIDCGCAYRKEGRLACLRLDDMKEFYSEPDWEAD